jgi:hypothetical protein
MQCSFKHTEDCLTTVEDSNGIEHMIGHIVYTRSTSKMNDTLVETVDDVLHVHWNDAPGEVVLCADLDELINARPGREEDG